MEDEREQTPNEVIIWGYRYTCRKCETQDPVHEEALEAAQADQARHRRDAHSGMEPMAGDPIVKIELRREPVAEEQTAKSSSGGGGWVLLVIILIIAYLASR
ncbi:hypothetical protein [Streptomyces bacillaris]|uniref:hypothetical protein n=1 Tax=Streptomyces bacillaris TaxID=68179 RepID=UPI0034616C37